MSIIQELKKLYQLTTQEIILYGDQVIDDFTASVTIFEKPIAIILGGPHWFGHPK